MPELPSECPRLPFKIDDRIDPTLVTAHAGVPLVIELFRHVGAEAGACSLSAIPTTGGYGLIGQACLVSRRLWWVV
jgi:hypothetical protein